MLRNERTSIPLTTSVVGHPLRSAKIHAVHLERLAIVYVRQSSPQQVAENRESTARQYALAQYAEGLGWPAERVLIIDEDQGQSGKTAEHRQGFQRLLSEVTLEHVGLVLGLEMSRWARSSKDWHHLFELCGLCGTLLADQEGIYEANDPNDRLILGLKGLMSELELQTMRNRLDRGRLNKAQRGEMFHGVPMGDVRLPTGAVEFDPDEQVRMVVQLIFEKFAELGSIYGMFHWFLRHDIQLPVRVRAGAKKGQLEWRLPTIPTLAQVLRHPLYAGAYVYGRRLADPQRQRGSASHYRPWVPMEQWKVLLKDRVPAYLTWEHYLKNRERIEQNRNGAAAPGVPRNGAALLGGVLVCGTCNRHMQPSYHTNTVAQYGCNRHYVEATEPRCYGLSAQGIDALVSQQVLQSLEPAALQVSLQAQGAVERERQRLQKHWQQRCQRTRYDVELAEQRYQAVDPANRLVAATLEKRWEEALSQERHTREAYDRFANTMPLPLRVDERLRIETMAADIPTLWHASSTTNADRKQLIRCLIQRVLVHVQCHSEYVGVTIQWAGDYESTHALIRPVATYAQLRDFVPLMDRVVHLREAGQTARHIAESLNAEGFSPPKRTGSFTPPVIYQLLKRRALIGNERAHDELLAPNEWWLTDRARALQMSHLKLRDWSMRGWVHGRKTPLQGRWILWADHDEVERLRQLLTQSRRGVNAYTSVLKTPQTQPTPASEPDR